MNVLSFENDFLEQLEIVDWGITTKLTPLSFDQFEKWVADDKHGALGYLADQRKELRKSLDSILPGCQSALVFLFTYKHSYFHYQKQFQDHRMASYAFAYGDRDYHDEIKERLEVIIEELKSQYPREEFRGGDRYLAGIGTGSGISSGTRLVWKKLHAYT